MQLFLLSCSGSNQVQEDIASLQCLALSPVCTEEFKPTPISTLVEQYVSSECTCGGGNRTTDVDGENDVSPSGTF